MHQALSREVFSIYLETRWQDLGQNMFYRAYSVKQ